MKYLLFIVAFTISTFTVSTNSYGQTAKAFFSALKNKDTNLIKKHLSSDVDLCIGDYQDFLSTHDATAKIISFLEVEGPKSYSIIHNGSSKKSTSNYKVANLVCKTGTYRVFIYFEKSDSTKISEIRFDK